MLTSRLFPLTQGKHYVKRYAQTTDEGVQLRDGTRDLQEMLEARYWLAQRDLRGHTVMDIGAGVGCFAVLAARRGAEFVRAYEPEQSRLEVLRVNASLHPLSVFVQRVGMNTHAGKGSMTWFVDGYETTQHHISFLPLRQLTFNRPSLVKISVKGGEIEYMREPMPSFVQTFVLKTRPLGERQLEKLGSLLPGMKCILSDVGFSWSAARWYEWRRG